MRLDTLEKRIKQLKISEQDEVSFSIDGNFVTAPLKRYINCLKQGLNVTMYRFKSGRPERCAAAYIKALGELLEQDNIENPVEYKRQDIDDYAERMPENKDPEDIDILPDVPDCSGANVPTEKVDAESLLRAWLRG